MPSYKDAKTGTWYCQFYYKDWTGKRKHKVKRGFTRKKDADEWERKFKNTEQKQEFMLSDAISRYESHLENKVEMGSLKRNTMDIYKNIIDYYIKDYFKDAPLSKVTTSVINDWVVFMNNTTSRRGKKLGSKTINLARQILSQIFDYANKNLGLIGNPVKNSERISYRSNDDRTKLWTAEEYDTFYQSLKKDIHRVVYNILFYTGLRRGEVFALTPADIVPYKLIIVKSLNTNSDVVGTPKTKSSIREVEIPHFLYDQIMEFIGKGKYEDTDMIFLPFHKYVATLLRNQCKKLGLPIASPHTLRHSYASILYNVTKDAAIVASQLGHSSPQVSMTIYTHAVEGESRSAVDLLENKLKVNSQPQQDGGE